jgi:hypothetical protein
MHVRFRDGMHPRRTKCFRPSLTRAKCVRMCRKVHAWSTPIPQGTKPLAQMSYSCGMMPELWGNCDPLIKVMHMEARVYSLLTPTSRAIQVELGSERHLPCETCSTARMVGE